MLLVKIVDSNRPKYTISRNYLRLRIKQNLAKKLYHLLLNKISINIRE